jgi:iron-sulfur cluster assembly protein
MIQATESAIRQLQAMLRDEDDQTKGLRILVENGGCAGMQYAMSFAHPQPGDDVLERDGVKFIVDAQSIHYLNGSTIDYCDDLAGTGFRLNNPNAARSCGCGTSFEPAEVDAHAHP